MTLQILIRLLTLMIDGLQEAIVSLFVILLYLVLPIKKQVVAHSSTEFEYHALSNGATKVSCIESIFTKLGHLLTTLVLQCDNMGAKSLITNLVFHAHTKHIEIYMH